MVKEFTPGQTEKFTMENGKEDLNRVMEFGEDFLETLTLGNGINQKLKDTVCINGKTETGTKENGSTV